MNLLILKKYDCKKIKNIHEVYLSAFSSSHFQTLKRKDFEDFYRMDAKIFMLYIKKYLIGYAIFLINGDMAEILSIGIKKKYQKNGYGKILIIEFLKKHKNIIKISLEVAATNTAAISFYLSMGFYKTGLRKNYYLIRKGVNKGSKVDAIILEHTV